MNIIRFADVRTLRQDLDKAGRRAYAAVALDAREIHLAPHAADRLNQLADSL